VRLASTQIGTPNTIDWVPKEKGTYLFNIEVKMRPRSSSERIKVILEYDLRPTGNRDLVFLAAKKLPALAISAIEWILVDRSIIFEATVGYIQHLSAE
jgi:hypothetical protein